ncbi:unnamed protein product [Sympodiomycopsis kandeliae]
MPLLPPTSPHSNLVNAALLDPPISTSPLRTNLSSLVGSLSFFIWLFAQTPQAWKNYKRKSVDGLSLVFLFQWILGDLLNLIGCILTGQLLFQIAVATWFVLVDLVLSWQVFHYTQVQVQEQEDERVKVQGYGSHATSMSYASNQQSQLLWERHLASSWPRSLAHSRQNTRRNQSSNRSSQSNKGKLPWLDMSASADHATLARSAGHFGGSDSSKSRFHSQPTSPELDKHPAVNAKSGHPTSTSSSRSVSPKLNEVHARGRQRERRGTAPAAPPPLSEHHQHQHHHHNYSRPAFSRSSSASSYRQMTEEAIKVLRIMERLEGSRTRGEQQPFSAAAIRPLTTSSSRPRGRRSSKKNVLASGNSSPARRPGSSAASSRSHSRMTSPERVSHPRVHITDVVDDDDDVTIRQPNEGHGHRPTMEANGGILRWVLLTVIVCVSVGLAAYVLVKNGVIIGHTPVSPDIRPSTPLTSPSISESPSFKQIVGRSSSWLCTILYVTSRLPQIWTNQIRRSCAGISPLLFIAAFLGNLFYALSILINPESGQWLGRAQEPPLPDEPWMISNITPIASDEDARRYLMESMPFLIGSAGTLFFDAVVLFQWLTFGDGDRKRKRHHHRHHHHHHHRHHYPNRRQQDHSIVANERTPLIESTSPMQP